MRQRQQADLEDHADAEPLAGQILDPPRDRVDEDDAGENTEREQEWTQMRPQDVACEDSHDSSPAAGAAGPGPIG